MSQQSLKEFILGNQELSALAGEKAYFAIASKINEPSVPVNGSVEMSQVLFWIAQYGIKPRLKEAVAFGNSQTATNEQRLISVLADSALDLVLSPHVSNLDMSDIGLQQMLGALVQAQVIQEEAYTSLVLASQKLISIAESETGAIATEDSIRSLLEVQ